MQDNLDKSTMLSVTCCQQQAVAHKVADNVIFAHVGQSYLPQS